jgi:hypothetical protein
MYRSKRSRSRTDSLAAELAVIAGRVVAVWCPQLRLCRVCRVVLSAWWRCGSNLGSALVIMTWMRSACVATWTARTASARTPLLVVLA